MPRTPHAPPLARTLLIPVFLGLLYGCSPANEEDVSMHGASGACLHRTENPNGSHAACIKTLASGMTMVADGKAGKTYEHIAPAFTFSADGRVIYRATMNGEEFLVAGTHEGSERFDRIRSGPQAAGDIQRFLALRGDTFYWVNMTMRGTSFTEELAFASRIPDGMTLHWPDDLERESTHVAVDTQKMQFAYPVVSRGGKKALIFRDGMDPFFDDVCCAQFSSDGETASYIVTDKRNGRSAVVVRNERRRKIGRWLDGIAAPRMDVPEVGDVSYDAWWNSDEEMRQFAERL